MVGVAAQAGQEQRHEPGQSDDDTGDGTEAWSVAGDGAKRDHDQWIEGDDERGYSGRQCELRGLGEHDEPVAAGEEQYPDDRARAELPPAHPEPAPPPRDSEDRGEEDCGHTEPDGGRAERREVGYDDPDAEVRRAPDHVDDRERDPHRERRWGSGCRHLCRRRRRFRWYSRRRGWAGL
jgi:hypothetical protein